MSKLLSSVLALVVVAFAGSVAAEARTGFAVSGSTYYTLTPDYRVVQIRKQDAWAEMYLRGIGSSDGPADSAGSDCK